MQDILFMKENWRRRGASMTYVCTRQGSPSRTGWHTHSWALVVSRALLKRSNVLASFLLRPSQPSGRGEDHNFCIS